MTAAKALLEGESDWTALRHDGGYVVTVCGEIFAVAQQAQDHRYSEDDLIDLDPSAWDGNTWEGMSVEQCVAVVVKPEFVQLAHV